MTIDTALVALVKNLKAKLASMTDARPSEIMKVKEQFLDDWSETVKSALQNISDADKIKAFDAIAFGAFDIIKTPKTWIDSHIDEDSAHYLYEDVMQNVFGPKLWDATNELENLNLPGC